MSERTPNTEKRKTEHHLVGKRTKDIFTFLFFVLVCFSFWFVQQLEEVFTCQEVTMPIALTDIPSNAVITTGIDTCIKLEIRGKGSDLLPYMVFGKTSDTLKLSVRNYIEKSVQSGMVLLNSGDIKELAKGLFPPQVTIISTRPEKTFFYYNQGTPKRVPVRLSGNVSPSEHHHIIGYKFYPDSVDVYAPSDSLKKMTVFYTVPLNKKGLEKSQEDTVYLRKSPGICTRPEKVIMKTNVDIVSSHSLEVPIVAVNFPANKRARTFPSTVRVAYSVPESISNSIKASDFTVIISYADLVENNTGQCRPHINQIPKGVIGARIDPETVDFLIESINSEESSQSPEKTEKKKGKK